MESEKVKEIKENLNTEIKLAELNKTRFTELISVDLIKDILTLINELENENSYKQEHIELWFKKNEEKKRRIAELEKENAKYNQKLTTNQWVKEIRKEALKQFAERLKEKAVSFEGERTAIVSFNSIDETLKECIDE